MTLIMFTYVITIQSMELNYNELPDVGDKILVADMSSDILSEPVDVSKYGLIFAGVQKNIGPAGMVVVIIREDLITEDVSAKYSNYVEV